MNRVALLVDVPDVFDHGVGTALQVPGSQGQLHTQILHVSGLSDGRQSVGTSAQQEVTEGRLSGRLVGGEKGGLHLERQKCLVLVPFRHLKVGRRKIHPTLSIMWRPTGVNSGSYVSTTYARVGGIKKDQSFD